MLAAPKVNTQTFRNFGKPASFHQPDWPFCPAWWFRASFAEANCPRNIAEKEPSSQGRGAVPKRSETEWESAWHGRGSRGRSAGRDLAAGATEGCQNEKREPPVGSPGGVILFPRGADRRMLLSLEHYSKLPNRTMEKIERIPRSSTFLPWRRHPLRSRRRLGQENGMGAPTRQAPRAGCVAAVCPGESGKTGEKIRATLRRPTGSDWIEPTLTRRMDHVPHERRLHSGDAISQAQRTVATPPPF